jgi:ribosomal-protein-alanine N-acetyltransferase
MTLFLPTKPVYLETKRLIIRPFQDYDASDLHHWASRIDVTRFVNWDRHVTMDDSIQFIKLVKELSEQNSLIFMAIQHKETKRVIGSIGVFQRSDLSAYTLELGYTLGDNWWGQGFTLEACLGLVDYSFLSMRDLERVEANCIQQNIASRRIMEKLGMQREGILRNYLEKNGYLYNAYIYSILRKEWMKKYH